jgi:hypothetical protein
MHRLAARSISLLLCLVFGTAPALTMADPAGVNEEGFGLPALLYLTHPMAGPGNDGRKVRAFTGEVVLKEALPARELWRIMPGTGFPTAYRPKGPVKVKLYTGQGPDRRLIVAVNIRYYRDRSGTWRPWYQLDSDTTVLWRGNAWGPLNPVADESNLVIPANTGTPNAEGYFPYLDLQSIEGPLAIDSWIVGYGIDS